MKIHKEFFAGMICLSVANALMVSGGAIYTTTDHLKAAIISGVLYFIAKELGCIKQ